MVNVGGTPGHPIGQRRMTNAEKQARWRLRHDRKRCSPDSPPGSGAHMNFIAPEMIVNCVPRGNVDLDELVDSSYHSMALYNKMIARVERWLDKIDEGRRRRWLLRRFLTVVSTRLRDGVTVIELL
jgi:hypothetical protein